MTDPTENHQASSAGIDDEWASALAEQHAASSTNSTEAGIAAHGDAGSADVGNADSGDVDAGNLAASTLVPKNEPTSRQTGDHATSVFQPLAGLESATGNADIDLIMDVPVKLTVELGRTRLTIRSLLQLGQGSVVELDSMAGEPMDIFVNGYLIAQGEVVVVDERYGIRLTDIITPSERINRLNRG